MGPVAKIECGGEGMVQAKKIVYFKTLCWEEGRDLSFLKIPDLYDFQSIVAPKYM